jgi:phage-related protein
MREIVWVKRAQKDFLQLPKAVQEDMKYALEIATQGKLADIAKPMKHIEAGLYEIALKSRGDAFRNIYTVKYGNDLIVLHVFQKKSTKGISIPKKEIDLIKERLKRIKEMYR